MQCNTSGKKRAEVVRCVRRQSPAKDIGRRRSLDKAGQNFCWVEPRKVYVYDGVLWKTFGLYKQKIFDRWRKRHVEMEWKWIMDIVMFERIGNATHRITSSFTRVRRDWVVAWA